MTGRAAGAWTLEGPQAWTVWQGGGPSGEGVTVAFADADRQALIVFESEEAATEAVQDLLALLRKEGL